MGMFDRYPQPPGNIPINIRVPAVPDKMMIMVGETTTHAFQVPFDVNTYAKDYCVIYKLGLNIVLVKEKDEIDVKYIYDSEYRKFSIVSCTLTPKETELFYSPLGTTLECRAQIKFTLFDDSIAYTEIQNVTLKNSLEMFDGKEDKPEV